MLEIEILQMMRNQANSLRVMGAAMADMSQHEGDEWHIHSIEVQNAAGQIESWVSNIGESDG